MAGGGGCGLAMVNMVVVVVDEEVNEEAAAALEEDGGVAILCGWFGWIFLCVCCLICRTGT